MKVCVLSHPVVSDSLLFVITWATQPARLLCPEDFLDKNAGVGFHFLLQGFLPTQRPNPCLLSLLHGQADSLLLSHLGSEGIITDKVANTKTCVKRE